MLSNAIRRQTTLKISLFLRQETDPCVHSSVVKDYNPLPFTRTKGWLAFALQSVQFRLHGSFRGNLLHLRILQLLTTRMSHF